MVYYFTSKNVKLLRNIVEDYKTNRDASPYEYMKIYIDKCPENNNDSMLAWIAETFLGIQKHYEFLKAISNHLSEHLSDEDQDYFIIIFHAVIFQTEANDMHSLYKCLFNLSKTLLSTFTTFLSNNEVLTLISQIAEESYDTKYISEKIITPLFTWQPYVSEMAHIYAEYIKKIERRKVKQPVVPIQPNVLNRKRKEQQSIAQQFSPATLPATPPNSFGNNTRKMLTKSAIDKKLKKMHEYNKQKAFNLLKGVKIKDGHNENTATTTNTNKSLKYYQTISNIRDEIENTYKPLPKPKNKFIIKHSKSQIKETTATMKRMKKRIDIIEEAEVEWLQNVLKNCRNTAKIEEIEEKDRQERERERLIDIEKKHLMGQISHEEAVLAKQKLYQENRKKYEEFQKEKEQWDKEIDSWKKNQIEKNTKQIERLSLIELNLLEAKNTIASKKKENVEKIKEESERLHTEMMKTKQDELEKKIKMIKEIKILEIIAKKARVPKMIDLTESSGIGLLCEMSLAELQERICVMKISLKEELEKKTKAIAEDNLAAKQDVKETKETIRKYINERTELRKLNKQLSISNNKQVQSKELDNLKKTLEEKRRLRMKLKNNDKNPM